MKKTAILTVPLLLGLLIALLAVTAPAQAGIPAQTGSDSDNDGSPEVYGIVESFPPTLIGAWTISGTVYTATTHTDFELHGGPFYVGGCVEVEYDPATMIADEIEMASPERCSQTAVLQLTGFIEQVPGAITPTLLHPAPGISGTWVISGTPFISTLQTRLERKHGPLVVGACARVRYTVVNGANLALKIESEKLYRCFDQVTFNQAYGYVVTFPTDLAGAWVISSTNGMSLTFMTTPASQVEDKHFPVAPGVCVKVKYFTSMDVNYATRVETKSPGHCDGRFDHPNPWSKLYATIDSAPPTTTVTGTWMLAGVNFTTTASTRFEYEEGPLEVGTCAELKYDPTNGAMQVRKMESEESEDCEARDGSPHFKLYGEVEMLPGSGYTGTWQVSGVSFTVNPTTTVENRHGELMLGAFVKVYFTYDPATGERTALLVKTHVAPGWGHGHMRGRFGGWLRGPSGDRIIVNGQTYLVDPGADTVDNLAVGDMVWINLFQDPDGTFVTRVAADSQVYLPAVHR